MVFSGVLHGVNPGLSPIAVVVDQSGTLVLGRENWVTISGLNLELPQAPDGRSLKILNSTMAAIRVNSSSGTISGVTPSGAAIPAGNAVRILPGQRGIFVASGGNWIAQGCEPSVLVFAYNGTPLSNNPSNPGGASDLIHYLGGVSGYVNPAINGTITVAASSVVGGAGQPTVLTDRVSTPTAFAQNWQPNNQANSWIAWQFPSNFSPTGFLLQTTGYTDSYHPRSFQVYSSNNETTLTSASPVSTWTQGPSWTNQSQITGAGTWHFFLFSGAGSNPVAQLANLRRLAILFNGPSSDGANWSTVCEVCWFGSYEV